VRTPTPLVFAADRAKKLTAKAVWARKIPTPACNIFVKPAGAISLNREICLLAQTRAKDFNPLLKLNMLYFIHERWAF
jgi:hypothetical protein